MQPDEDDQDELMNERMCIVTRETLPTDQMIRFVAGPDGSVVPDLKRVLPGRGCSVKAERAMVEKAVQKNIFARALKKEVKPARYGRPAAGDADDRDDESGAQGVAVPLGDDEGG